MESKPKDIIILGAAFASLLVAYFKGVDGAGTALIGAAGMLVAWFTNSPLQPPPNAPAALDPELPIVITEGEPEAVPA